MKLPKKIKILGFTIKVKNIKTVKKNENECNVGYFNTMEQLITVSDEQCDEQRLHTFMHELIHAIDYMTDGTGTFSLSEAQTDRLALGMTSVLMNNKVNEWL
jgi:Zn-dependent peptidase ImmA (M78 family)